jgi:PAS domain S-box-containing protein
VIHDAAEVARRAQELTEELGYTVAPGFEVFVAKARRGGPDEKEWTYIRKDGSRFPVLLSVTALRDEQNRLTGFLGIASDITERKRAEEAMMRLASIVESSDDAIIGSDLDGFITSWNQGAERIYGYTEAEILGRHVSLLAPPDKLAAQNDNLNKIRQEERVDHQETVRVRKDGRLIDISLTLSPIRNAQGQMIGISSIARDITRQKQAETELRKLSRAVQQSPATVVITDAQGNIEYVNPKFTQITGYSFAEAIGQNPRILKSGEKSPEEYKELWDTITSGKEWRGVFHNKKKSGELYWESASISPIEDSAGVITHFIAVKEDITAIKEAQDELAKLSLVASKTDNAVVITDKDGLIEWVNDGFSRMTGYTLPEVAGKKPGPILQGPLSDPESIARIRANLKKKEPFTEEILNYHKSGQPYWVSMDITPIRNDRGEVVKFISIQRDITPSKEAEEALRQAKDAADAANRAKTEFLASMSHEIRTPMNAIIGMAELLDETPLNPEQRKFVDVFRSAGETLLNIINDILDLSKVEAGQITLEKIDFDLGELVEKVCEVMALRAHEKGIELACRLLPEVPVHLMGDPGRLRQVLTNLLGNAIKFTEKGEVVLEVGLAMPTQVTVPEEEPSQSTLIFTVRDTGIGIPPEKLDYIFEKFTQADASTTRRYGGTGLGLPITKRLVELMGGEIKVASQPGQGSIFSFTLTLAVQPQPKKPEIVPVTDLQGFGDIVHPTQSRRGPGPSPHPA